MAQIFDNPFITWNYTLYDVSFFFQKNKWQTTSYSPSLTFLYIRFDSYFFNKFFKNINKLFYSLFQ
jgi:hypothetical protein